VNPLAKDARLSKRMERVVEIIAAVGTK
jgi:hypothetical protein